MGEASSWEWHAYFCWGCFTPYRTKGAKHCGPECMVLSVHLSSWSAPDLHSLFRSNLKVVETQKSEACRTNFQLCQFLIYRHVMHLKKFLKVYWLNNWNKKCQYLWENNVFDHFRQKIVLFYGEKKFWCHFFCRSYQKNEKMTLPDECRYQIWKSREIWDYMVHPPQNGSW